MELRRRLLLLGHLLILTKILPNKLEDRQAIVLVRLVNDNGNSHGKGGQNESEKNGEVAFVAAATAASFTAGAHGATRFVQDHLYLTLLLKY